MPQGTHRFEDAFDVPAGDRRLQQFVAQLATQFVGVSQKLQVAQRAGRASLSDQAAHSPGNAGSGILRPHRPADHQHQVSLQKMLEGFPRGFIPRLELPSY
jgi:hypothetical protein